MLAGAACGAAIRRFAAPRRARVVRLAPSTRIGEYLGARSSSSIDTSQDISALVLDATAAVASVGANHSGRTGVSLCWAQSVDGSLAAAGSPLALSGAVSSAVTQRLRLAHDALLVGVGTILTDNPRLTTRLDEADRAMRSAAGGDKDEVELPSAECIADALVLSGGSEVAQHCRVVIADSWLATPLTARVLEKIEGREATTILTTREAVARIEGAQRAQALQEAGANVLAVGSNKRGRVDLAEGLELLRSQGLASRVMVEGGAAVLGSFLSPQLAGLATQVVATIAPVFVGGLNLTNGMGAHELGGPQPWPQTPSGLPDVRAMFPLMNGLQLAVAGDDILMRGDLVWPRQHEAEHRQRETVVATSFQAVAAATMSPDGAAIKQQVSATSMSPSQDAVDIGVPKHDVSDESGCGHKHGPGVGETGHQDPAWIAVARPNREAKAVFAAQTPLPTAEGTFNCRVYQLQDVSPRAMELPCMRELQPIALTYGDLSSVDTVPVRVHDQCFTSEVLGSLKCDCADQLRYAKEYIASVGAGVVVYMQQEGRGIGLANKIRAYELQETRGLDTVDANRHLGLPDDARVYWPVADVLADLGVKKVSLLTNNPRKRHALESLGFEVADRVPVIAEPGTHNAGYMISKARRMSHMGMPVASAYQILGLVPPSEKRIRPLKVDRSAVFSSRASKDDSER